MDPKLGPKTLSAHEAARQRAPANALKMSPSSGFSTISPDISSDFGNSIVSSPQPSRQPTPASTPVNSDDDDGITEEHRRVIAHAKKCAMKSVPRCTSAPGMKLPPKKSVPPKPEESGKTGTRSRAVPAPPPTTLASDSEKKAAAPPRAPAGKCKSQDSGQESPGTKVPSDIHPMATRRARASGAGSLRLGGGSGPTDTRVDLFHPSKT
jgi:hypothetical protein